MIHAELLPPHLNLPTTSAVNSVLSAWLPALAKGWRNSEIARELNMAENTVEYHIRHLFGKLAASSRSEVIVTAQHLGWLDSRESLC